MVGRGGELPEEEVNALPSIDAEPVRRGRWVDFANDYSTAECSKCGEIYEVSPEEKPREEFFRVFSQFYKFCPNCGAKMDGE